VQQPPVHPALVSKTDLDNVRLRLASRGPKSGGRVVTRTKHTYCFTGLLFHHACGRRMQATWNHDRAHYRCRYPSEYALANDLDHPPSVYLLEDRLAEPLDTWLAEAFHPDQIEHSLTMLEQAQPETPPALTTARSTLSGLDQKLNKYRALLEAGTDPAIVATWIKEVQNQRAYVTAQITTLEATQGTQRQLSKKEIKRLIGAFGGLTPVLRTAEPCEKQEVYRRLGVKLTFDHTTRTVEAEAIPQPPVGVVVVSGGGPEHSNRGSCTGVRCACGQTTPLQ
jgi:hypothetical protein